MTQRKIMFRGLTKYDGWKYGFFVLRKGGHHYIFDPDLFEWWEVLPETVGQYTGLKDVNDQEIWEGDVYKMYDQDSADMIVMYNDCTASFDGWNNIESETLYSHHDQGIEILGTIHTTHKELIKQ